MSTNSKTLVSLDYAIKYLLKDKGDYEIIEGFISAILKDAGYLPVKITALLGSVDKNFNVTILKFQRNLEKLRKWLEPYQI